MSRHSSRGRPTSCSEAGSRRRSAPRRWSSPGASTTRPQEPRRRYSSFPSPPRSHVTRECNAMRRTSRRRFLMMTGTTGVGLSLPAKLVLGQLDGDGVPFTDYRALVCVFLLGGNDSFNMLVPRSPAEYNAYASSRQNMALPRDDLLPIAPVGSGSREFGLHPAMPELQALFESGHAAFVVNVGPLVEPTTKAAYLDGAARLPPRLFSHSDQQAQWHMLASPIQSKVG